MSESLYTLQSEFFEHCTLALRSNKEHCLDKLIRSRQLPINALLNIYQHSTLGNLTQVLALTFPVVEKLVGEAFFQAMAREYIKIYRPNTANIDNYGDNFSMFIADFSPAKALPYLADVAKLEWLYHQSSLCAAITPMKTSLLTEVSDKAALTMIFHLASSVQLLHSAYPLLSIWHANQASSNQGEIIEIDNDQQHYLAVFKRARAVEIVRLSGAEYKLLSGMHQKMPLEQLIDMMLGVDRDINLDALMNRFMGSGVISHFTV
ncbi:HvfC/BufC family peptide modification chaperone [Thalassotalea sp. PLHSN55]|uniref:HvfC/BufC family peptide modification chaperone n=1 Tax=Thalassotalea sp. PLHSN55 TaxID=3435888 RepID=UPI003F83C88E